MDIERRIELILRSPTEEFLTKDDLKEYLEIGIPLIHYIGFEISGLIHLGTGLITNIKVRDLQKAGVKTSILLADWHSWINKKLGSDFNFIREVAKKYFGPLMKDLLDLVGGDSEKLKVAYASDLVKDEEYWKLVLEIGNKLTLNQVLRSVTIMGRKEHEILTGSQLIYPLMQAADIFYMGITLAHGGTDQRKVHVRVREVAPQIETKPLIYKNKKIKPLALHHKLIKGLQEPPIWPIEKEKMKDVIIDMKMSKSKPYSCIFVHDSEEEIKEKIRKAFCPAKNIEYNPIIDIVELIVFNIEKEFTIEREEKFGGDITYYNIEDLKRDYIEGKLHPLDLKNAVSDYLVKLLAPIRRKWVNKEIVRIIREKTSR